MEEEKKTTNQISEVIVEDNNTKIFIDDTIDLTEVVKDIKKEEKKSG